MSPLFTPAGGFSAEMPYVVAKRQIPLVLLLRFAGLHCAETQ